MLAGMAPTGAEVSFIEIGVSDPSKSTSFLEQMFLVGSSIPLASRQRDGFRLPPLKSAYTEAIRPGDFSCTSASRTSKRPSPR